VEAENMRRRSLRIASLVVLALAVVLAGASSASADFSITGFSVSSASSVAGAHADLTTDLSFSTRSPSPGREFSDGNLRDLTVDLPPGLVGDPEAVPQCAQTDFVLGKCPPAAQAGVAAIRLSLFGFVLPTTVPVFNMEPRSEEETAEIAFSVLNQFTVHLVISVRTDSDYGLRAKVIGTSRIYGVNRVALTLWGVPGDPIHDPDRRDMAQGPVGPTQLSRAPFLTNPTSCNGPLEFSASANSYQAPTTFSHAEAVLPQQTGCDSVPFSPGLTFEPTTSAAGAPAGYQSVLTLPESKSPDGQATANLRNAVVTLPRGVAINPSGAVGLGGCDDASLNLKSTAAAACPGNAQIGTAQFDVPVLPKPIQGKILLGSPCPATCSGSSWSPTISACT
jgi:hypothetical protein